MQFVDDSQSTYIIARETKTETQKNKQTNKERENVNQQNKFIQPGSKTEQHVACNKSPLFESIQKIIHYYGHQQQKKHIHKINNIVPQNGKQLDM